VESLYSILAIIAGALIIAGIIFTIKSNPASFSRENLSKSFTTLGYLALILMVFVAFLVFIVRQ